MTREEIIDELCRLRSDIMNAGGYVKRTDAQKNRFVQALSEEIQKLQTEPCEDCISRQAVLSEIEKVCFSDDWRKFRINNGSNGERDLIINYIKHLPSIQPEKVGHWIEQEDYDGDVYYDCSACGNSWTTIDGTPWDNGMNYCPCCGAKMEEWANEPLKERSEDDADRN